MGGGRVNLITIDPGLTGTGMAAWVDGKLYLARALSQPPPGKLMTRVDTLVDQARAFIAAYGGHLPRVVIERPQTYRGRGAGHTDANDLLDLMLLVGGLAQIRPQRTSLALPAEWKAQRKVEVVVARAREVLSLEECMCIDLQCSKKHQTDVWSAVGIGLWALRRAFV